MIHRKETAEILSRIARLVAEGGRAALATVVRIEGSAYRRPGAKLLIEESGGTLGSVSGGCLEADVREIAREVMANGRPWLRHYDTGAHEDILMALGLGCNGAVDVFVQPATSGPLAELAPAALERLESGAPLAILTGVQGNDVLGRVALVDERGVEGDLGTGAQMRWIEEARRALDEGRSRLLEEDGRAGFVEALGPPLDLLVIGAGDDAQPLVEYAADVGFRVTVVDHRPALATPVRFPQASRVIEARPDDDGLILPRGPAVVKTHSLAHDREWVRRLLAEGSAYVGLLGPVARKDAILDEIGARGDSRLFGPVGLDLGAEGARQIAVAIVAELLAFTNGRSAVHLSARRESIHVR